MRELLWLLYVQRHHTRILLFLKIPMELLRVILRLEDINNVPSESGCIEECSL